MSTSNAARHARYIDLISLKVQHVHVHHAHQPFISLIALFLEIASLQTLE